MTNKRKVFFRADAGQNIGYGHFIRSLALAEMLEGDFDCTFFTQSPTAFQRKAAEGICSISSLPADHTRFDRFLNILKGDEVVVLDNYFFTSEYQKRIKDIGCALVCIDDMHDKHYYADLIINHGFVHENQFSAEPYCRFLLGPQYSLLRNAFIDDRHNDSSFIRQKIVVCFGGADPLCLTGKVIKSLLERSVEYQIHAIVGEHFHGEYIDGEKFTIHKSISAEEIADLYRSAKYAIVSLSTACLEAWACGATVMAGWYADNQRDGYEEFVRRGIVYGLGDISKGIPDVGELIISDSVHTKNIPFPTNIRTNIINAFYTI